MKKDKSQIIDVEIVAGLKAGEASCFKKIFQHFERRLYHFVFSFTKSEYQSEDIIQEVFIKVWEQRELINIHQSFESFIYTITRNLTYNYLRDSSRRQSIRDELWINISSFHQQVEADIIYSEYKDIVEDIVRNLPQQKRSIYQLSKLEGRSHKEIADLLGISTKTVKNHLWKTMDIIRHQIQPYLKDASHIIWFLFWMK